MTKRDWLWITCGNGHDWQTIGGRACPFGDDRDCSQPVFKCTRCPAIDFGERGGPGFYVCEKHHFNCSGLERETTTDAS